MTKKYTCASKFLMMNSEIPLFLYRPTVILTHFYLNFHSLCDLNIMMLFCYFYYFQKEKLNNNPIVKL